MKLFRLFLLPLALGVSFFCIPTEHVNAGDEWMPLDPSDLAMKTSVVEKDADAEAIFWLVRVADEIDEGGHT